MRHTSNKCLVWLPLVATELVESLFWLDGLGGSGPGRNQGKLARIYMYRGRGRLYMYYKRIYVVELFMKIENRFHHAPCPKLSR